MLAEQAVLLVEWPQRGEGWLPAPDLWIDIAHRADGREIAISADSERGRGYLLELNQD